MPSETIILLAALGPLREALARASEAIDNGGSVTFICFSPGLFKLLLPLKSAQVEVMRFPESFVVSLKQPWGSFHRIQAFRTELSRRWGKLTDAEVWAYGTSISLPLIIATTFLARRNIIFYNGEPEGRGAKDGIFLDRTKSWLRKLKGSLLGMLCGAPIEYCRDWSPAIVLSESYVRSAFKPAPVWSASVPSSLEKLLRRSCDADVVVLFINYCDYYSSSADERDTVGKLWDEIGALIKACAGSRKVAVKPHPTSGRLPESWAWMEEIPSGFPAELLDFPHAKVALGDSSMALVDLMTRPSIKIISFVEMYKTPWTREIVDYLDNRVDPEKRILRVASLEELAIGITKSLAENGQNP